MNRKFSIPLSLCCLIMFFFTITTSTSASGKLVDNIQQVSDKPISEFSDAEIQEFLDLALSDKVTVQVAEDFFSNISEDQLDVAISHSAKRIGVTKRELKQARNQHMREGKKGAPPSDGNVSPNYVWESWRQNIENKWTWGHPAHYAYMSSWGWAQFCENTDETTSNPDWDYQFYTPVNIFRNPNGLRWTTTSSAVYTAFQIAYGGNLNSFSYSFDNGVYSCLGQYGVNLAGGPNNVRKNVFMHPNN